MHPSDSAITVDLQVCPQLGKSAEQVRAKVADYVKRMHDLGKSPSSVVLFADDYDRLMDTLKRKDSANRTGETKPPPIGGLSYGAIPVQRGGR